MTDTPKHIKDLQLKLWLAKTPGERCISLSWIMMQCIKHFVNLKLVMAFL